MRGLHLRPEALYPVWAKTVLELESMLEYGMSPEQIAEGQKLAPNFKPLTSSR
jgi:hypothetical protein